MSEELTDGDDEEKFPGTMPDIEFWYSPPARTQTSTEMNLGQFDLLHDTEAEELFNGICHFMFIYMLY